MSGGCLGFFPSTVSQIYYGTTPHFFQHATLPSVILFRALKMGAMEESLLNPGEGSQKKHPNQLQVTQKKKRQTNQRICQLSYEKKKPPTFHYTGWFIGILILAY